MDFPPPSHPFLSHEFMSFLPPLGQAQTGLHHVWGGRDGGRCQQLPWLLAELTFLSSPCLLTTLKKPEKNGRCIPSHKPTASSPLAPGPVATCKAIY